MPGKKYITILMDYDNMNYAGSNGGSSNNETDISDTLTQGLQFQKYLKKISGIGAETVVEQFVPISDREKQQKLDQLENLKRDYDALVNNFERSGNTLRSGYERYLNNLPDTRYTNKHVTFAGQNGYVTRRGVFKSYDGSGNMFNGINGCPSTSERVIVAGATLSTILTNNSLTQGTSMQDEQNCGDEGTNVVVTDFGMPGITYRGCYQASDNAFGGVTEVQPGGAIYNVNSCKTRAVQTGAAVFALGDFDPSLNKAKCYTGATFVSPTSLGNAYIEKILWTSAETPVLPGAFLLPYKMQLKNGGFISIIDSSTPQPQLVKQILNTGNSACQIIPYVTDLYETPTTTTSTTSPVSLLRTDKTVAYINQTIINPNYVPSFSFQISDIYPQVPVLSKNYTIVYKCGDVVTKKDITGGSDYRFIISCDNNTPNCVDYFLTLNDGKIQINKGTPTEPKETIYTSTSYGPLTDSVENLTSYPISGGKNLNRISGTAQLINNEYITSIDGKLVLIMQSDGHLVLKTFTQPFKCSTRTVNNETYDFGGLGSYALYNFTSPIDNSNIGKLAYIDEDGFAHAYPSSMISREQNNYKSFINFNSPGNNLEIINNSTNTACKLKSDKLASSGGYVYDNNTKTCFIKNNSFNLNTPKVYEENVYLNVKRPVPIVPISCNDTLTEIDSTRWSKYKKGVNMSSSFSCGASKYYSTARQNIRTIEEQLYVMAIDIINKMNELQSYGVTLSADMTIFKTQLKQSIDAYNASRNNDNVVNSALSGMMSDVDLMVLQENSRYLFLSIFAVGAMVVALNAINK
jgi:hypothetical protein